MGEERKEPRYTIFGEAWNDARRRAAAYPATYGRMLDHLEAGWGCFSELQDVCDTAPRASPDAVKALLYVAELEVVDLFRWLAGECVTLVPGAPPEEAAWMEEVESESETLLWYLLVTEMAVHHSAMPESVRVPISTLAHRLIPWTREFLEVLDTIAQARGGDDGPD